MSGNDYNTLTKQAGHKRKKVKKGGVIRFWLYVCDLRVGQLKILTQTEDVLKQHFLKDDCLCCFNLRPINVLGNNSLASWRQKNRKAWINWPLQQSPDECMGWFPPVFFHTITLDCFPPVVFFHRTSCWKSLFCTAEQFSFQLYNCATPSQSKCSADISLQDAFSWYSEILLVTSKQKSWHFTFGLYF